MCITKLTDRIDISHNPFIRDARLVRIDGNGSLRVSTSIKKQRNDDMNRFVTQISLNDVPLIQMNRPECPTCMGLLATGLGIETAECAG